MTNVRKNRSYCAECKVIRRREICKRWRDRHPELNRLYQKECKRRRRILYPELDNQRQREYNRKNPDKLRAQNLRRKFGMTLEEYQVLLDRQGGVCAICQSPPEKKALAVDHKHDESNAIRGLLCECCNRGLGLFRENPMNFFRAVAYLAGCLTFPES